MTITQITRAILRHMTPAMGATGSPELARATVGTALGIALTDLLLWSLRHMTPVLPGGTGDPRYELILVSPFAATLFLILTVPNSPLAQPWSVIVGNTLGVACGVLCVLVLPYPVLAAAVAVGLSVVVMASARALHPPGAAMALNAVLLHFSGAETGVTFVLATVTLGSVFLVLFGLVFNPMTGRTYPFRLADQTLPAERQSLEAILERLKLSANIGVTDLSRLIATVEAEATAQYLGSMKVESFMTRAPITISAQAPKDEIVDTFRNHAVRTIPVVDEMGRYLGLLPQLAMLDVRADVTAGELVEDVATLGPDAGMTSVLPLILHGRIRVVPVVRDDQLLGIVTRSDLITMLSRALRNSA